MYNTIVDDADAADAADTGNSDTYVSLRYAGETKIEAIQNRAARYVTGDYSKYNSVSAMKQRLDWEPLQLRRKVSANRLQVTFPFQYEKS